MENFPVWILPLLPFVAFLANGLAGRRLGREGGWLAFWLMAAAALISTGLLTASAAGAVELPLCNASSWEWIAAGDLSVSIGLHYDQLTAVMCFVITFIGSLVFLYSIGYMDGDPGFNRFFAYLSLFVFAMLILVLADSFPLMFVGWEGVGLCSYLLIGYYMDMPGAPDAGKKAFIVNRVGDAGFLLGMFLIYKYCGTLNIADANAAAAAGFAFGGTAVTLATLLLFLGCTGKSAQIPLFVWLPDAMAGPTPVSALIHAATMVTAGVYLVVRTSPIFAMAPFTLETMAVVGAATAFVAGTIALTQRDIKKVLAYSTVSQLGFMFLACGVGAFSAGIFHVFTHAFFKACLFLGAGTVIHALHGNQDLMRMGGLRSKIPVVWLTFLISCLAIGGFPGTSGFFSKDEILWKTLHTNHRVLYLVALATAFMTVIYSWRALLLAFHGRSRLSSDEAEHLHMPHWTMEMALVVLSFGALGVGFLNVPHVLAHLAHMGDGAHFEHFLHPVTAAAEHTIGARDVFPMRVEGTDVEFAAMGRSIILALLGIFVAWHYFLRRWPSAAEAVAARNPFLNQLSSRRWWWDDFYNFIFAGGARLSARFMVWLDRTFIDGALHGTARVAREGGRFVRRVQAGQVQAYALALLLGANLVLLLAMIW